MLHNKIRTGFMFRRMISPFLIIGWVMFSVSAVQAGSTEIRFAFQDRIGSVVPIVAVHNGYFTEVGLAVKPMTFSSGPACAEALYSGAADIGAMGDTTAIVTVSRTDRFRIIASHATGEHRHRIMVKKGSPYSSLKDLKGKRLAVKKGTSTYGGLLTALKRDGIALDEIQIVDLSPSIMNDALAAGSIDAFAASEPTPSLSEGKASRQLITLGGLGNEYPIMILADRNFLKQRAADMVNFIEALKKAEKFAAENPEQVAEIMASETGLSLSAAKRALELHQYRLRLDAGIINSLSDAAVFLQGQNIISQQPDFNIVADPAYLQQ